jgi:hypothetical protein
MSSTRSRYREFGLELVSLEDNLSHYPQKNPTPEEKRNKAARDPMNVFLTKALAQQRNEMLEIFSQILQQLSTIIGTSSSSSHFGYSTQFKVQVNFEIPIF